MMDLWLADDPEYGECEMSIDFGFNPAAKPEHGRRKKKRGKHTEITDSVRKELDRRSREKWNTNVRCCEWCGYTNNLTAAHMVNASQYGSGSNPANAALLCGTHGFGGCHDWADNTAAGRAKKLTYAAKLRDYYNGEGKKHWKGELT